MKRTFLTTLTIILIAAQQTLVAATAHAAPAGLYFNPMSGTVAQGSTFSTQLRLNASNATDVKASFRYDPARLLITAKQTSGTDFTTTVEYDNTAGTVSVSGSNGTAAPDKFIAGITFKAITPGTASLAFTGTNQTGVSLLNLDLITTNWTDTATNNATYTILDRASNTPSTIPTTTTPPATGDTTGTPSSTSPGSTSPSPAATMPSTQNRSDTKSRVESHQEEVEGAYSRITGEQENDATAAPATPAHTGVLSITAIIGSIVATVLSVALFFMYRGYRLARLRSWFAREASLLLAFDPRDTTDPRTTKPLLIKHISNVLKLLTYHPIKLLESGLPHQHVPFSKRRGH